MPCYLISACSSRFPSDLVGLDNKSQSFHTRVLSVMFYQFIISLMNQKQGKSAKAGLELDERVEDDDTIFSKHSALHYCAFVSFKSQSAVSSC